MSSRTEPTDESGPRPTALREQRAPGPDFLGIGAQKAGTTWIADALLRHPSLWLPPVKELHFWNEREQGVDHPTARQRLVGRETYLVRWRRHARDAMKRGFLSRQPGMLFWHWRFLFGHRDLDWYRSLFVRVGRSTVGEIDPEYQLLGSESIADIKRARPDLRLFIVLREPVDRAWSQVRMDLGRRQGRGMEDIPETEVREYLLRPEVVERGRYAATLGRWLHHFDRSQLSVLLFEDLATRPVSLLDELCSFLGVEGYSSLISQPPGRIHAGAPAAIPPSIAAEQRALFAADTLELLHRHQLPVGHWLDGDRAGAGGSRP